MSRLYKKNRDLSQPLERLELVVDAPDEGRFDRFLVRRIPWRSRAGIQEMIESGGALLNGIKRKPATKVRAGDRVVVSVQRPPSDVPIREPQLRVLYEDEYLLALDKESGVVVHPVGVHQQGTLLQTLHARYGSGGAEGDATGAGLPKLAHRLDQFTSGVLLVAKRDEVRRSFSDMLTAGAVRKAYATLVLGSVDWERKSVDAPIGPVADSRILMAVDQHAGKSARSEFIVSERFDYATHVAVRIGTGRTHQIRVHAAHLGVPVLGDHLYGDGLAPHGFERFVLHAHEVRFDHPVTGAALRIEAPLPEAMVQLIQRMRAVGGADADA